MANRMEAGTTELSSGHMSLVSHPNKGVAIIKEAATTSAC